MTDKENTANVVWIIGRGRIRINLDGQGVRTLVAFSGCPLRCRYCLNDACHFFGDEPKPERQFQRVFQNKQFRIEESRENILNPKGLYEAVKKDNIYFQISRGGITFGGGEPGLQSLFIKEFREICGDVWQLDIETSLNYSTSHLETLLPVINKFYIDIKDMNGDIYKDYTCKSNELVYQNLQYIVDNNRVDDTIIRVPHIPNYNTPEDVKNSIKILSNMGFHNIDEFTYGANI